MSGGTSRSSGSRGGSGSHGNLATTLRLPSSTAAVQVALPPLELVQKFDLPVAVHFKTPAPSRGVDPNKPLLLYKKCNTIKVRAESLRTTSDGRLAPVGPTVVIPDSYTGWFSIMDSRGSTATCYTTMAQLVKDRPASFLTRYDLPAYAQQSRNGVESSQYLQGAVHGGEVLKLMAIYGGTAEHNNQKFAQCLNYKKEIVLIPLTATGRFYITALKSGQSKDKVYLINQIMKRFQLPVTVKLVCGYMPRTPCAFTGVLRLQKCQKESVILACTMTSKAEATLMEMDLHSHFLLAPIVDPIFCKSPIYLKTLSFCEDEVNEWQRQIKVTHHVTERRSRSLTRSFSDKFVDTPLPNRPLSMTSLSNAERIKPIKCKTPTVSENHIGKLASKVRKIKESKRKESTGKENENDDGNTIQIGSSGTKLFEKHRVLSKQNTYVKDISRLSNRPLPDPHEKDNDKRNKLNIRESLNSLKRYKMLKNRPLPNPNAENFECEDSVSVTKSQISRVNSTEDADFNISIESASPIPTSFNGNDSDEDDNLEENLYSEIDDYALKPNMLHESDNDDEDEDQNSSNSSKENSIDTKTKGSMKRFFKSQGVTRSFQIQALIHDLESKTSNSSDAGRDDDQYDHYATLTIESEDEDCKLFVNERKDEDIYSGHSSISEQFCDSLEDISTITTAPSYTADELQTFVDGNGTIKKKYYMRQRKTNIYETLNIVSETECDSNVIVNSCDKLNNEEENNESPYASFITMIDNDNVEQQTNISILKHSSKSSIDNPPNTSKIEPDATSAPEEPNDSSISKRGNIILIKVQDDCPATNITVDAYNSKDKLRKCSSVSSINIIIDDNELGVNEQDSKDKEPFLHRRYPSTVTISDPCVTDRDCDEVSYYNTAPLSISVVPNETTDEDSPLDARTGASVQPNGQSIGILSPSNELVINCEGNADVKKSRDSDSKSVDSGNATDDIDASEDSFDSDSLADESEGFSSQTRENALEECEESPQFYEMNCNSGENQQDHDDIITSSDEADYDTNEVIQEHLRCLVEKLSSGLKEHMTSPSMSAVPYHEMLPPLPEVDEDVILEIVETEEKVVGGSVQGSRHISNDDLVNSSPSDSEAIYQNLLDSTQADDVTSTEDTHFFRNVSTDSGLEESNSPDDFQMKEDRLDVSGQDNDSLYECKSTSNSENQSVLSATDSGVCFIQL